MVVEEEKDKRMKAEYIQTVLCSAFPATGKTRYCTYDSSYMPEEFAIDSDSSKFDKQHFPENYIEHVKSGMGKYARIFISSHEEVRKALVKSGLFFILVYPELGLKDEYLYRMLNRGNDEAFLELISSNWNEWISQLQNQRGVCSHRIGEWRIYF